LFELTNSADLAEVYATNDLTLRPGDIVGIDSSLKAGVKRAEKSEDKNILGIVSTDPASVIGGTDGEGVTGVAIALSGRVPVNISTENGLPVAGDMIAMSSRPGYGMRAIKSGYIVGQLMSDAVDNGDGTATGIVFVRQGYWQAPVSINLAGIFGDSSTTPLSGSELADLELGQVAGVQFNSLDQDAVDEILRGFSIQKGEIDLLKERVDALEASQLASGDTNTSLEWQDFAELMSNEDGQSALRFIGKVTFIDKVVFNGEVVFGKNMSGEIVLPANQTSVYVQFDPEHSTKPSVIAVPQDFVVGQWRVAEVTHQGFMIDVSEPQPTDTTFSWQAITTE
jgi:hypothetical protein